MKFKIVYELKLGELLPTYYNLLKEEDFNFKTKEIKIELEKSLDMLYIRVNSNSLIDLKIGSSAVQKSLEIIEKTLSC